MSNKHGNGEMGVGPRVCVCVWRDSESKREKREREGRTPVCTLGNKSASTTQADIYFKSYSFGIIDPP